MSREPSVPFPRLRKKGFFQEFPAKQNPILKPSSSNAYAGVVRGLGKFCLADNRLDFLKVLLRASRAFVLRGSRKGVTYRCGPQQANNMGFTTFAFVGLGGASCFSLFSSS